MDLAIAQLTHADTYGHMSRLRAEILKEITLIYTDSYEVDTDQQMHTLTDEALAVN